MKSEHLAGEVRQHYRVGGFLSDDQLDSILKSNLVQVIDFPFAGRLREVVFDRCILVRPDLPHSLRRWLICHGFWHVLEGKANRLYLDEFDALYRIRDERNAEKFAGHLLIGRGWRGREAWELASDYAAPQDRIERWLRLIA